MKAPSSSKQKPSLILSNPALESTFVFASYHSLFRTGCLVLVVLFGPALNVQTGETRHAVRLEDELHYRLVFENSYARVFRATLPGHAATLAHRHDLPYIFVTLAPADFVDAVADKPEEHVMMTDAQVRYSQGGFTHIVRSDSGSPLDGIIIELLKPQGEAQNTCGDTVAGPPKYHCSRASIDRKQASDDLPLFETGQTHVSLNWYGSNSGQIGPTYRLGTLIVVLSGSVIQRGEKGKPEETLSVGSTAWLVAESPYTFINQSGKPWSYLSLSFEGTEPLRPEWKPR